MLKEHIKLPYATYLLQRHLRLIIVIGSSFPICFAHFLSLYLGHESIETHETMFQTVFTLFFFV